VGFCVTSFMTPDELRQAISELNIHAIKTIGYSAALACCEPMRLGLGCCDFTKYQIACICGDELEKREQARKARIQANKAKRVTK
jgi:hypothetical protein